MSPFQSRLLLSETKHNGLEGPRFNTTWEEYDDAEIMVAWGNASGQGHQQAVERGRWCIVVECDVYDAISLSRLWIRNLFALPTCCNHDGKTLSLYCGDAGSDAPNLLERTRLLVTSWPIVEFEIICHKCGYFGGEHNRRGECH